MNAREANVLLTKATLLDPRLSRTPVERVEQAEAWADVLAEVSLGEAIEAMRHHYRNEERTMMPVDVLKLIPWAPSVSDAGNVTELRLAAERRAVTS